MKQKEKLKLKPVVSKFLIRLACFLFVLLGIFLFYNNQINTLVKIGYSKESSKYILFHKLKKYVLSVGENKTLDCAFSSEYYNEEYLEKYQNIDYVEGEHFITNINALLEKGYSVNNINLIFKRGTDSDVLEFSKRDKVKYLDEFFGVEYSKLKYYDRYVKYSDETGEDDEETVLIVNMDLDKDDYTDYKDVTEFSTNMLVNKHRKLNENFEPTDLVKIEKPYTREDDMYSSRLALNAFIEMYNAASNEGYGLVINSAYRSYADQEELCDFYRSQYGDDYVKKYVAQPGFSEHQTGLGFDIGSTTSNIFLNSKEYGWMQDNAYKYGFILRFPSRYVRITGFNTEPWHYRYVGSEIATYIHEHNMPYEKYYAMFLDD